MSGIFGNSKFDRHFESQLDKHLTNDDECQDCSEPLNDYGYCPNCNDLSPCCGALITDTGLCSDCREHI